MRSFPCTKSKKVLLFNSDYSEMMIHDLNGGPDIPFPIEREDLLQFAEMVFKDELIHLLEITQLSKSLE